MASPLRERFSWAGFAADMRFCLRPRCPHCRQGRLYRPWTISVVDRCAVCGAQLGLHDIGDGAAVFLTFILSFTLVPMAWVLELMAAPPLWVHAVVWGAVGLAMIILILPALKAYIILLEHRHRPHEMGGPR
jgi:uncharacterized protein (DUF983 family)